MKSKSHPLAKTAAGLAALAAAAGAYYFYGSKHAAKNRKTMKTWAVKARGDVMEKLEQMKNLSQQNYQEAVNEVLAKYKRLEKASPKELDLLKRELHGHWKNIAKLLPKAAAKPRKTSKK
jgi:hypothetical protein